MYSLQACVCVCSFQPGIFTGWGSEGVKTDSDKSRFNASFNCIVQELCESGGGRPGLSVLTSLLVSVDVKIIEPCFGIGHNLSLICQLTS